MKQLLSLIFLFFSLLFISCNEKKYSYVEVVSEQDLLGKSFVEKEPIVIYASNDSAAYVEAFKKYCISERVYNQMKLEGMELDLKPFEFHLYDENQNEILPLISKDVLKRIHDDVLAIEIGSSRIQRANDSITTVDSTVVKKLSELFVFEKDEFDPKGITWIKPKSAPKYTNRNALYCYFMSDEAGVSNFRFRIQYYADDWLFFYKCQFSIDGKAFEFVPLNVEHDNDGGYIWEWFDESISTSDDIALIKALAAGKTAKIKFIGKHYYDIKQIPEVELESIKNTIDLYVALGGKFE